MRDMDYLTLLSHEFPNARSCAAEMINLEAIMALPKGNEYFFSDIHGEYESFIHLLRGASGVVRSKIREAFGNILPEAEQELSQLLGAADLALTLLGDEVALVICDSVRSDEMILETIEPYQSSRPRSQQVREILRQSEPLPRTANGKIKRWELNTRL